MKAISKLGLVLTTAAAALISACGGSNSSNSGGYLPPGCVAGQVCNYNALAAGSAVIYQGDITGVNSRVASQLALAQNGNLLSSGISYNVGTLTVTAQGNSTGGTTYNINLTIQPTQKSFFTFCASIQSSCYNPIIVTGNASYYPMSDGTQWLILQYGGIKLEVIAPNIGSTNNAFNGTTSTLSNVQIKVVKLGRDFMSGDLLGTTNLLYTPGGTGYNTNYSPGIGSVQPFYNTPNYWGW